MLVAMCGAVAVVFGLTLGALAIVPAIGEDLGATQTEVQWVADVVPLTVAALLLPAGALLDRLGRRTGMLAGLLLLVLALVWCAVAGSPGELVAARAASGAALALVFPGTLATISDAVPDRGRSTAVGLWALSGIVGGVLGMQLSALLADLASWRDAFWVFAAVVLVLVVLTARSVPAHRSPERAPLDPLGTVLSVLGIGALVLGITEGPVHGWTGPMTVAGIGGGLVLLALFVAWQLRAARPLLDVRVYRDRTLAGASIVVLGAIVADFAMIFLVFQFEVYVLGFGALKAALGIGPPAVVMLAAVPAALAAGRRWTERTIATIALLLCAAGALVSALVAAEHPSYLAVVVGASLIWTGIGFGAIAPTLTILDSLPGRPGLSSALNDLTRELGAALGLAITASAFNAGYRDAIVEDGPADATAAVLGSPAGAPPELAGLVAEAVRDGWQTAFLVVTAILALTAVAAAITYPRRGAPAAPR
jgi:MFS family permease